MASKYKTLEEWQNACKRAKELSKQVRIKRANRIKENNNLPYSFDYKVRKAFIGKECPICHCIMGGVVRDDDINLVLKNPSPSIQHNIPISLGGKNDISNISVICRKCNSKIGNRTITEELNNKDVRKVWKMINGWYR